MPDWVTHLGTTYIGARGARIQAIRPVLLGALLPDVTRFSVVLIDFLDWPAVPTFAYLIPFHSLLIVSLLAGAVAVLFTRQGERRWRVFWLIQAGAAFHFLLDELEGEFGCGSTTFYPFYFGKPLNLWPTDGIFATLLLVLGGIGIGVALATRSTWPPPAIDFRPTLQGKNLLYAGLLLGAALVIPLFTRGWLAQRNAYYLGFFADPSAWEGATVELCFSEIVAEDPLLIEEFDTRLPLAFEESSASARSLTVGDWVSLRGVYRDGAIHPTLIDYHQKSSDVVLSGLAGIVFVLLWLPSPLTLFCGPIARRRPPQSPRQ